MPSPRWKALKRETENLRKQFLPVPFDPVGIYPNPTLVQAHTRAFLVLCHAEIESYLEEWAKEITRACEVVWDSSKKLTPPLVYLIATKSGEIAVPESLSLVNSKDIQQRLADALQQLFPKFYKTIKSNNGLKEKNFWTLFAPLGIPNNAVNSTLLPNLDSLGERRGKHAHHSARIVAVENVLDPEQEYKSIVTILDDLLDFDGWLICHKRTIR